MSRTLRALDDAADATTAESRAAALQYVRLVTRTARPHPDDAREVESLVLEIARATARLSEISAARAESCVPEPIACEIVPSSA